MPGKTLAGSCLALSLTLAVVAPVGSAAGEVRAMHRDRTDQHRVVWDEFQRGRKGIHLRVADEDGSGRHRVYDRSDGFALELHLDPAGERVAFSPCCKDEIPRIVVASLDGSEVLRPLARHPRFYSVGAIGWSRDGRQLVFEGFFHRGDDLASALWRVNLDGAGLRHVVDLPDPEEQRFLARGLAWTRRGVVYSDGRALRVARAGRSRVVLPHVTWALPSADGRRLLVSRRGKTHWSIWTARTNGRLLEQVHRSPRYVDGTRPWYHDFVLDRHGRSVLAFRESADSDRRTDLVAWSVMDGRGERRVLDISRGAWVATWY